MLRAPEAHELDDFASCVEAAFLFHYLADERERFVAALEPARSLVAVIDGAIVGTLASHLVEMTLPGLSSVSAPALTDVGVAPTHRHLGIGSGLVRRFLDDAHDRGEPLALLDAAAPAFYRALGFGPATWSTRYRIAPGRADLLDDVPGNGVVLLRPSEALVALPEIFDDYRRSAVGEIMRSPERWRELLEEQKEGLSGSFVVAHHVAGRLDGYVRYRRSDGGIFLEELVATSDVGYRALWAMLFGLDRSLILDTAARPTDEPARHLLADPSAFQTLEVRDGSWLRLIDLRACLELRRYSPGGTLSFLVSDALCPWNDGPVTLVSDEDGRGVTLSGADEPELSLSVGALAMAHLGATSFTSLVRGGRATELRSGAARRGDRLFEASPAPFRIAEL